MDIRPRGQARPEAAQPGSAQLPQQAQPRDSFTGGLLTVLLTPSEHTLDQCLAALHTAGVQAWTEHLPAPVDLAVVVAATRSDEAPGTDAIADARRSVVGVLDAAGIDVDVHGTGYVCAATSSA